MKEWYKRGEKFVNDNGLRLYILDFKENNVKFSYKRKVLVVNKMRFESLIYKYGFKQA